MLFTITTNRTTIAGTHNQCCKAWTYQYVSAAQPNTDTLESHTDSGANRTYQ